MRVIDKTTVAFESDLETKYAQYLMDLVSKTAYWEYGDKVFTFKGNFQAYEQHLAAFCFISIEQSKPVVLSNGIPDFNDLKIESVEINGFTATLNLDPNKNYKMKKLNKLAKHWAKIYPFTLVEVVC